MSIQRQDVERPFSSCSGFPEMKGFFVKTFGCQFNELYSGSITDALEQGGYRQVADLAEASLVIINTCAIRAKAEEKAFSFLGEAAAAVSGDHIVFMGCTATLDKKRAKRIAGAGVHVIDGKADIKEVLQTIRNIVPLQAKEAAPPRSLYPTASIEIVRGCESYCTYCIVPRVRGPEIAVAKQEILRQARGAVADGFSEILLLGQNINKYRWQTTGLVELAAAIDALPGTFWFWFLSSHPANFTAGEVQRLMTLQKIEHRLHLPLQSGSDRILARMNRGYTVEQYAKLAAPIRSESGWSLTTDIIVGFPGETEDDFEATVAAVQRFRFDGVFLAKYSDRPGTPASRMPEKVAPEVIDRRHAALLALIQDIAEENNCTRAGQTIDVIVLTWSSDGHGFGRSCDGRNVWFTASLSEPVGVGAFIRVTVDHASREGLYGCRTDS